MNHDTPLPEVAHLLGAQTAAILGDMPPRTQEAVLHFMRHAITSWEESGVCLDPITLETVLHDPVVALAALHSQNQALMSLLDTETT